MTLPLNGLPRPNRILHVDDDVKAGAVRVSLGIVSNAADVAAFLRMAEEFLHRPSI
jgi:selenocysteine lyase/cysteine desulfurase